MRLTFVPQYVSAAAVQTQTIAESRDVKKGSKMVTNQIQLTTMC